MMSKQTKVKVWIILSLFALLYSLLILGCNSPLNEPNVSPMANSSAADSPVIPDNLLFSR